MRWLCFAALGALAPLALFALLASSVVPRGMGCFGPCVIPIRVSIADRATRLPAPGHGPRIIRCGPFFDDPRDTIPDISLESARFPAPDLPFDSHPFVPAALRESILGAGARCHAAPELHSRPEWPERATRLGIREGWVLLEFDISGLGFAENTRVIEAEPRNVFEASAIRALEQRCPRPALQDGRAVVRTGVRVRILFESRGES